MQLNPLTELGLILALSALKKDRLLFKQAIFELSASQSQDAGLRTIKITKSLLSQQQKDWIEGQLRKMHHDPHDQKRLPHSAYLWQGQQLKRVVAIRFTDDEYRRIEEFAKQSGKSKSEWMRVVLGEVLEA